MPSSLQPLYLSLLVKTIYKNQERITKVRAIVSHIFKQFKHIRGVLQDTRTRSKEESEKDTSEDAVITSRQSHFSEFRETVNGVLV